MRSRVPVSERSSQRIEQLMNALGAQEEDPSLSQLGLRKIIEELLEAEVADRLGRGYYERGSDGGEGHRRRVPTSSRTGEHEVRGCVPSRKSSRNRT